jgi:dCTP deaminase
MILTDREIRISVERGLIEIDPPPDDIAYSSTAVDLTLDSSLRLFHEPTAGLGLEIKPADPGFAFKDVIERVTTLHAMSDADGFLMEPRRLILAYTREKVWLKAEARLAARVEGKSSLARFGLAVHITAPTIHSGFRGQIQLEMLNFGPAPIRLRTGMRICQLIFEQTSGVPDSAYSGQFAGQGTGAAGSGRKRAGSKGRRAER